MRQVRSGMALGLDHDHLADNAVVDLPDGFREQPLRSQLLAGGKHPVRCAGRLHHRLHLGRRDADGLLAVHMLAAFQREDGHFRVQVWRRGDVHGFDILAIDDLAPVRVRLWVVAPGRGRCLIEAVGLQVAESDYLGARLLQYSLEQIRPAVAGPDQRGSDLSGGLANSGLRSGGCRGQEKVPAMNFHDEDWNTLRGWMLGSLTERVHPTYYRTRNLPCRYSP